MGLCGGSIGTMENKIETTIWGSGVEGPRTQIIGFQGPHTTIMSQFFGDQNPSVWVLESEGLL